MKEQSEQIKDANRGTLFGSVAAVVTFIVNAVIGLLPETIRVMSGYEEAKAGVLVLVLAGTFYLITYVDSKIHHDKTKLNGLTPKTTFL